MYRNTMHSKTRQPGQITRRTADPTAGNNLKSVASAPLPSPLANVGLAPSHGQIAARAEALWREKGFPQGRDDETWLEAERQLRAELQQRIERDEIMLADPRFAFNRDSDDLMAELNERFPGRTGKEPTSL
jgi:hypothetical protein